MRYTLRMLCFSVLSVLQLCVLNFANAEGELTLKWAKQISSGSASFDGSEGVALDGNGNVFVAGTTDGSLGEDGQGSGDAFASRFDEAGSFYWTAQFGSDKSELVSDISTDRHGSVYVTGLTTGVVADISFGGQDTFLSKYDVDGSMLWKRQIGGVGSDDARGITSDRLGNVYVTGYTFPGFDGLGSRSNDVFLTKFDADGTKLWTKLYGTEAVDRAFDVQTDDLGNVYLTGYTWGEFPGFERVGRDNIDAFLMKLDSEGVEQWTTQIGTREEDYGNAVAVDALGNAYITGYTAGELEGTSAGEEDVFLTKVDPDGELLWTRQFGAVGVDRGEDLAIDAAGHVYVTGRIESEVRQFGSDQGDGFVSKYTAEGDLLWMHVFGTNKFETSQGIAVDSAGAIYVSGSTEGNFDGRSQNSRNLGSDVFVAKFSQPVPEPSSYLLSAIAVIPLISKQCRWQC